MKTSKFKWFGKNWKVFVLVIFVLIIIRLILPYIILQYANKTLAGIDGYYGHINDINLSIYRGAYQINDFYLDKIDSVEQKHVPFISSKIIDLSIEWRSLFHGKIVGELEFSNPVLHFVKEKVEPEEIQKDTSDFRTLLKKFMPLKINRFVINYGSIKYTDSTSNPPVNIFLDNAQILAENLSSIEDTSLLPSTITAQSNIYGGELNLKMKIDPLAGQPTFDLNLNLENTDLVELNDFFKAYANVDINKGTFGLFIEVAAKEGRYIGYVKPVIKDLDVVGPEDRNDTFLNKIWEGIAGASGVILRNQKEEQIATKIPLEGNFKQTNVGTLTAIVGILRNAFIQAVYPAIDNQINLNSVNKIKEDEKKGFFQKVFGKSENKQDNPKK